MVEFTEINNEDDQEEGYTRSNLPTELRKAKTAEGNRIGESKCHQ